MHIYLSAYYFIYVISIFVTANSCRETEKAESEKRVLQKMQN